MRRRFFFSLLAWLIWDSAHLECNTYIISCENLPAAFEGYRIAQISDLHNGKIGKDNQELLSSLTELKPDMIAVTGDLVDSRNTDLEVALRFMEQAMLIAPCYYVTGNHEARIDSRTTLKAGLEKLGVIVLGDEKIELDRSGEKLALLGVEDPDFETEDAALVMAEKLGKMEIDSSAYTVLLSHRPEFFEIYKAHNIDLVLSGHTHGGQVRLPFLGALIAPGQGLFPAYDAGLYSADTTNMIISRGLGNSLLPFRINCRPEVILVELTSQ